MSSYIALIHKEDRSDYGVSFPDFPGCITAGATLDEARANAVEALAFHIDGMMEDGETLPEPSELSVIMRDHANRAAVAFLVDVPSRSSKTVRVNITLPENVLRDIDTFAEREGYTRSGLIVKAALSTLSQFSARARPSVEAELMAALTGEPETEFQRPPKKSSRKRRRKGNPIYAARPGQKLNIKRAKPS